MEDTLSPEAVQNRGPCTIGRVLDAIGDKWTLRVLCEAALNGVSRFPISKA